MRWISAITMAALVCSVTLPAMATAQPPLSQSLAALAIHCLTETSTADFGAGSAAGTMVSETDSTATGGAVRLVAPVSDLFLEPDLSATWEITLPSIGYTPVIQGGVLDVQERDDETYETSALHTTATFNSGVVFEARAKILPGSAFVSLGFFDDTASPDQWAYFSTRGTGNMVFPVIYTSVRDSSSIMVNEPTIVTMSAWHDFKIVWQPDSLDFYVDDVLIDSRSGIGITQPQRVGVYKSQDSDSPLLIDWVRVTPYVGTPGTFESQVLDAGGAGADWQNLLWQGDEPVGTTVAFETRTGETMTPDVTWTDWETLAGSLVVSAPGRYAQYRTTLTTGDLLSSPAVNEVDICYFLLDTTPPVVTVTSPVDLAVDIDVGTAVTASFNESLEDSTVNSTSFTLTPQGGSALPATVFWDSLTSMATLVPAAPLDHATTYEARVTTAVTDLDGNALAADHVWTFTTEPPDLTPPVVTATDPADGAVDILAGRPVRATFSEAIDPATLTISSFTLTPSGGAAVAAAVTWDAGTFTATITPTDTLAWDTTHEARLTTTVTDLAGNPLAFDEVWTFTTRPVAPVCVAATTTMDLAAGTLNGTMVSEMDSSATGGQLWLESSLHDNFEGSTLDPQWNATRPDGYVPVIADGILDLQERDGSTSDVSAIESQQVWGAGTVLEARVMFVPGSQFIDVGFDASTLSNTQYAWFSTAGTGNQPGEEVITARVRDYDHNTVAIETDATFNEWHIFKIVWNQGQIDFYVDGVLKATHTDVVFTAPMRAAFYKSNDSDTPYWIDWIRVTPFEGSPGSYESPVVDAKTPGTTWASLDWMGSTPTGTSVSFETRTGETAIPDGGWSTWSALNENYVTSPPGRFGQYRSILATGDLLKSPVLDEIVFCYDPPTDLTPPSVVVTAPADTEMDVPTDTAVTATFNKALDPTTLTTASFTLTPDGGSAVPATVSYDTVSFTATLVPDSILDYQTVYTGHLATTIADTVGNLLQADYDWTFTTSAVPDTTAPTVLASFPLADAVDVAIDTFATATFDEAIDPATLTTASFTLTPDGGSAVAATVSLDVPGTLATLVPDVALDYATLYTAQLTTAVTDTSGNGLAADFTWSFTTGVAPPDTVGPMVLTTVPADAEVGVSTDVEVTAEFDEALDPATMSDTSFILVPDGGSAVAATVSYDPLGSLATLTPGTPLAMATLYTAHLSTAITDTLGNPLAAEHVWSFTTAAPPDVTPPTVLTTVPVADALDVTVSTSVSATFDEAMDPASLTPATFTLTPDGGSAVAATVDYDPVGFTATLTPDAPLAFGVLYEARLTSAVADTSGNGLAVDNVWSFTTGSADMIAPWVTAWDPTPGAVEVPVESPVRATFSETIDPATLTSASFSLTPQGGSAIAAVVSYDAVTFTATLVPASDLEYATTYEARLTTAVTDPAGNPLAGDEVWTFTTRLVAPLCRITTSTTDFAAGLLNGVMVSEFDHGVTGGQLRLQAPQTDLFLVPTLDPMWQVTKPNGAFTPDITDGILDGQERDDSIYETSAMEMITTYGAGVICEMRAMIQPGSAFSSIGFVSSSSSLDQWAFFSTRGTGDDPVPVIHTSVRGSDSSIADIPTATTLDEWHDFKVVWLPGTVDFYVDGALVDTRTSVDISLPQRFGYYKSGGSDSSLLIDWVRITPYSDAVGSYESVVQDAGEPGAIWTELASLGTVPTGTTVSYETRTGETSSPDGSWSAWDALSAGAVASPAGRYAQYRAALATSDLMTSPVVDAVQFCFETGTVDTLRPTVLAMTPLADAIDVAIDTFVTATFDEAIDPATLTIASFTLTPDGGSAVAATVSLDVPGTLATLVPDVALDYATLYTAQLTTAVTDTSGNALAADFIWSFTTAVEPDTTAPTVLATVPDADALDVLIAAQVTATFDEAIDPATLTIASFTLTPDGGSAVAATVSLDVPGTLTTLVPDVALDYATLYTAQFTTAVTDISGNALAADFIWSFTTAEEPDTAAPTVLASFPLADAVDVAIDTFATATFDEAIDPATLTTASFTLTPDGGSAVAATVSLDVPGTLAMLVPDVALDYATLYTAQLTTAVTDTSGNALAADYIWSFTTAEEPDTTAPTVVEVFPAIDAVDAPADTSVTAIFSEPIDPATLTAASFTLSPLGGDPVSATVSWDESANRAVLLPDNQLDGLTIYEARLTTAVTDTLGNALAADYVWTFTTVDGPVSGVGESMIPRVTALMQNTPNPFNPRTTIAFDLANPGNVRLKIYSVDGRMVRTLVTERMEAGRHSRVWDGKDNAGRTVPTGVYLMRLETPGATQTKKMLMLK